MNLRAVAMKLGLSKLPAHMGDGVYATFDGSSINLKYDDGKEYIDLAYVRVPHLLEGSTLTKRRPIRVSTKVEIEALWPKKLLPMARRRFLTALPDDAKT